MWGGDQIGLLNPLFLALLVQAKRKKGKERKKEQKESSVWKFQDIKVRKNILTLPFIYLFIWFELGLRLNWILFWFGLELSIDKDQKCVNETCRYLRGNVVQISLKPMFFVLSITWPKNLQFG